VTVGSLGDIIFKVSSSEVETLKNLKKSGGASYGKHSLHCGDTLLEFTGRDAGSISFDITLCSSLGVNVTKELEKIEGAERSGRVMRLILGKSIYGKWVIVKHSINYKYFDREQNPTVADVSVSLTEYL
jgi:hypothetical protein